MSQATAEDGGHALENQQEADQPGQDEGAGYGVEEGNETGNHQHHAGSGEPAPAFYAHATQVKRVDHPAGAGKHQPHPHDEREGYHGKRCVAQDKDGKQNGQHAIQQEPAGAVHGIAGGGEDHQVHDTGEQHGNAKKNSQTAQGGGRMGETGDAGDDQQHTN